MQPAERRFDAHNERSADAYGKQIGSKAMNMARVGPFGQRPQWVAEVMRRRCAG